MSEDSANAKPDIAMPFCSDQLDGANVSVLAVRPETNKVDYESVILQAIMPMVDVIYMANLSGNVVKQSRLVERHCSSQMRFANNAKHELLKFPEMKIIFEKKFGEPLEGAPVIGSFEAVEKYQDQLGLSANQLFEVMVSDDDFLEWHGQTIKRVNDYYIVNYDLPAIIRKYDESANIFVIAMKLKDNGCQIADVNYEIYQNLVNQEKSILGASKRKSLAWYNQVRRTYHISKSPIEAMFDFTEYVFDKEGKQLDFDNTPLGRMLMQRGIMSSDKLKKLRKNPLVSNGDEHKRLVNIVEEGKVKDNVAKKLISRTLNECCDVISQIDHSQF